MKTGKALKKWILQHTQEGLNLHIIKGGYSIGPPELPELRVWGKTLHQAKRTMREAVKKYRAIEDQEHVPKSQQFISPNPKNLFIDLISPRVKDFPFYIGTKQGIYTIRPHSHKEIEVYYVHSGRVKHTVRNRLYFLKAGDLLLINKDVQHKVEHEDFVRNPVHRVVIRFGKSLIPSTFFDEKVAPLGFLHNAAAIRITLTRGGRAEANYLFNKLLNEMIIQNLGYRNLVVNYLLTFLFLTNRAFKIVDRKEERREGSNRKTVETIDQVLDLIDNNLSSKLSLRDLANKASLSLFHFSRLFKTVTGYAPHQYVMNKRILEAKSLLSNTDEKITSICYKLGFELSSFINTFKKESGITPSQYRSLSHES